MSAALAVLLGLLKAVGILLLAVLVLLLAALCVPVAADFAYRQEQLTLLAHYGPLSLPLYPAPPKAEKPGKKAKKAGAKARKKRSGEAAKAESGDKAAAPPTPGRAAPARQLQAYLDAFKKDPMMVFSATLAHIAFAGGRLLHGVHVRDLQVFWTVTAPDLDAAATAVQYGALLATLNDLLVRARQHIDIQADFLRLEPDFTGEQRAARGISCKIKLRPLVVAVLAPRLLLRLWRDPVFKGILAG